MKKVKAPSAKTLARRAQEAALIAQGKRMKAQFQMELAQHWEEREKKEQKGRVAPAGRESQQSWIREGRELRQAREKAGEAVSGYLQEKGLAAERLNTVRPEVPVSLRVRKLPQVERATPEAQKPQQGISPAVQNYIAWKDTKPGKLGADAADKTRVSDRQENAGQSLRYQQGITDIHLLFDGQALSIINTKDSVILQHFPAVSGRKENGRFDYSRERQRMKSVGPLPEGEYHVDMNELQKITLGRDIWGTITKPLPIKKKGAWPGGRMAWGSQRAWLSPQEVVIDGVKRDKFSIHGGAEYGSAGCIDLRENASAFFDALKYYLQNIPSKKVKLIVKYK